MKHRPTITREELRGKIERGETFALFEVLPEPYYRKQHLPGAVHMPPNDIAGTAEKFVSDKNAEIVLYCWDEH